MVKAILRSSYRRALLTTDVVIIRGRHRGRGGWISGSIEDRRRRGITKAIVKIPGAEPELLSIGSFHERTDLFASPETKNAAGESSLTAFDAR